MPGRLGAGRGCGFGFVNAPGLPIPVWWAPSAPDTILAGWSGGEAARELLHRPRAAVVRAAVRSLAALFGASPATIRRWLVSAVYHPWTDDPFSRGAYSFPAAGFEHAAGELARPVRSTLFFAGEATSAEFGTVHGALESGVRAAREAARALKPAGD
jgi:monoamine oxidase